MSDLPVPILIMLGLLPVWLLWAWVAGELNKGPNENLGVQLAAWVSRTYLRHFHRAEYLGSEHVPQTRDPGPLIVVANHTAGIDPLLVQALCPFFVRWMMSEDMQLPAAGWFWRMVEVIGVDRGGHEVAAARVAIRHLKDGGVVGIFPEGALERPPHTVMKFAAGVGLIVRKSGARVLPVVIDGTPQVDPAWASLWRRSKRATVTGMPIIDYSDS
ncbi:MAG: lysophospholipid acyltransferase family protein, partial [Planctomycetota bacterium]